MHMVTLSSIKRLSETSTRSRTTFRPPSLRGECVESEGARVFRRACKHRSVRQNMCAHACAHGQVCGPRTWSSGSMSFCCTAKTMFENQKPQLHM
jgi:hypothetical protein